MSLLYERIESLCKMKNVNITTMCKEAGLSRGSLTDLKMGRIETLSTQALNKLSEYFGVSTDFLLGKAEQNEKPSSSLDKELEGVEFALFGEVKELTDDEKEDILAYIKFKKSQRK